MSGWSITRTVLCSKKHFCNLFRVAFASSIQACYWIIVGSEEPNNRIVHISLVCLLVGWTQREIGETVGLSQRRVGQKLEEFEDLLKLLKSILGRIPHRNVRTGTHFL